MSPQRIRLSRARGWRKPEGAVVVARPSKWGNPYKVERTGYALGEHCVHSWDADGRFRDIEPPFYKVGTLRQCVDRAVAEFRAALGDDRLSFTAAEVREFLAGRDLACWCPLDQPCHADVLLEAANS